MKVITIICFLVLGISLLGYFIVLKKLYNRLKNCYKSSGNKGLKIFYNFLIFSIATAIFLGIIRFLYSVGFFYIFMSSVKEINLNTLKNISFWAMEISWIIVFYLLAKMICSISGKSIVTDNPLFKPFRVIYVVNLVFILIFILVINAMIFFDIIKIF